MAVPPAAEISAATAAQLSLLRLDITTRAPCCAICTAIALPIPRLEPVMRATLPDRSNILLMRGSPALLRVRERQFDSAPGHRSNQSVGQERNDSGVSDKISRELIDRLQRARASASNNTVTRSNQVTEPPPLPPEVACAVTVSVTAAEVLPAFAASPV